VRDSPVHPTNGSLFTTALATCGADVAVAASVDDALKAFEETPPDVIVSDIAMPDRDGYDLIRCVRALSPEHGAGAPAIALTAYASAEDRKRALEAGFQHHLAKPVDPVELAFAVAALTRRRSRGAAS
jgi:CheY-like chemotaxis protein